MASSQEQKLSEKYEKHIWRSYRYLKATFGLGTTAAIATYFAPLMDHIELDNPLMDASKPLLFGTAIAAGLSSYMFGSMTRSEKRLADSVAVNEIATARSESVFPADWAVGNQRALEKMVQRPGTKPPTMEEID